MSTDSGNLYIGRGVAFQGAISVPKSAVIHGDVRGTVTAQNLNVEKEAVVAGQIEADIMEVSGVMQENIKCNGLLRVNSSGQIHGSLEFGEVELAGMQTPRGVGLACVVLVWCVARISPLMGSYVTFAILDFALLPIVFFILLRLLVVSANKRNLPLISLLLLMAAVNGSFHLSNLGVIDLPAMRALHAELALILLVIVIMAGRVIPMFTKNVSLGVVIQSSPRFELSVMAATVVGLFLWIVGAASIVVLVSSAVASLLHVVRLLQWKPQVTLRRPILWVLHASYAWIPIGFMLLAMAQLELATESSAVHAFSIGAVGGLIIGMITRTARGHTGRLLEASPLEVASYVCVSLAAVVRVFVPLLGPHFYVYALHVSALAWGLAFAIYLWLYGPWLSKSRIDGKDG